MIFGLMDGSFETQTHLAGGMRCKRSEETTY
jgi:hypothetical protein